MTLLNWSHHETAALESRTAFRRKATQQECNTIAAALEVLSCSCLEASYKIIPLARKRYRVHGSFRCSLQQTSVISLEPINFELNEVFDVEFWPESQLQDTIEVELDDPNREDPEPIVAGQLEVGRLIYELIASQLDPYPRKDGETFELVTEQKDVPQGNSAFAKLAALKKT